MAGGATMASIAKSFPGLAMGMRSRLLCLSSTATTVAMTTGNATPLSVTLLRGPGRKKETSEAVERDQLLYFPNILMLAKGFSYRWVARP